MGVKKGAKYTKLTNKQKKQLAIEYSAGGCSNIELSKKYGICNNTLKNIVNDNLAISEKVKEGLSKSMEIGAGIVGNLAIAELKEKNLSKEKPRSLSAIAVDMHKIATGQPIQALQVNVNIPSSREEILSFLQNKTANNNVIDTSDTMVLSDNEIMPDK